MTTDTLHPLAAEYLKRLRRAGRGLPPGPMRELLAEIEGHLSEAIDPSASDAQALTALDKLGEPEAIIAAETPRPDELPAVAEPSTPVCRNRRSGGGLRSLMLVRSWGLSVSAGRGAGRPGIVEREPGLSEALDGLIDPVTRGDPESPLRWTSQSGAKLAGALCEMGYEVVDRTVLRLLRAKGYSLQANKEDPRGRAASGS